MRRVFFLCLVLLLPVPSRAARAEGVTETLRAAVAALKARDTRKALRLAEEAVQSAPTDARAYLVRGMARETLGEHAQAIADFSKCIELDPKNAEAFDHRGSEQFKLGRVKESLADFDRALALDPARSPGHWKRGISLYYAGRYDEGRKQFKGYEQVDRNDVENAVWHFLCAARADGLVKARAALLPIGRDRRVPMMEVYDLFKGKLRPADVLRAAEAGEVTPAERRLRLFYAHLYLGLYFDATGDPARAREHIALAAGKYHVGGYMGDVARVHRDHLDRK